MLIYAVATEHMNGEQRLEFEASIDPAIARARRLAMLTEDPDIDVAVTGGDG